MIEAKYNAPTLQLFGRNDEVVRSLPADPDVEGGRLTAFLQQIRGETIEGALTTADVIRASRTALLIQQAADQDSSNAHVRLASDHH